MRQTNSLPLPLGRGRNYEFPAFTMTWRRRPVLSCRRHIASFLSPFAREHPTRMGDHDQRRLGLPRSCTFQHGAQRLPATRRVMRKVAAPLVNLSTVDVRPCTPLPCPKVEFTKQWVDVVSPPPATQPSSDLRAALQVRCEHHARQTCLARELLHATGKALGLAAIDRDVGRANASTCGADRPRMAPGPNRGIGHVSSRSRQVPSKRRPR